MSYSNIATVQISLQSTGVTGDGFGIPLFASSHRYFPERVRSYGSLTEAAVDLPVDSPAYKAVSGYFSNSPRPSLVKIGRREAGLSLTVETGATSGSLTFSATDGVDSYTVAVDVSGQADEDAVATAIASAIEADSDVGPLVVASALNNVISIDVAGASDDFWVKDLSSNLTETYNTTETAAELLAALTSEDDDFYFFSCDDNSETFVLAAAADIEARTKTYFVSVDSADSYSIYTEGSSTDLAGKIADANYTRTKVFFHQGAGETFPETVFVGKNAAFDAGRATWSNLSVSLSASQNSSTGNKLSSTEKSNLEARNVSYVDPIGGLTIARNGRFASGENIDVIRGRDNMISDAVVAYTNLLVAQQGSKVPYNNTGILKLQETMRSVLNIYVARGFINDNFTLNFPQIDKVPTADREARVYNQGSFEAELTGAIESVKIQGVLTLDLG